MKPAEYTAFGQTKKVSLWVKDPRCVVSKECLIYRLKNGWDPETALTTATGRTAALSPAKPNKFASKAVVLDHPTRVNNYSMPPGSYVPPRMGRN